MGNGCVSLRQLQPCVGVNKHKVGDNFKLNITLFYTGNCEPHRPIILRSDGNCRNFPLMHRSFEEINLIFLGYLWGQPIKSVAEPTSAKICS